MNTIRTATATNANSPASIPPTIAPVFEFFSGVPSSGEDIPVPEGPEVDEVEETGADVPDGALETETGDCALRHEASSEAPTCFTSELPPLRPLESVMMNTREVLLATSAIQSKDDGPTGGLRMKDSPAGMTAYGEV